MVDERKSIAEIKDMIQDVTHKRKIARERLRYLQRHESEPSFKNEMSRLKKSIGEYSGWREALKWVIKKDFDPLIFIDDNANIIETESIEANDVLPQLPEEKEKEKKKIPAKKTKVRLFKYE